MMQEHIWYASYGSNLWEERFLCYIRGGTPAGSATKYNGCKKDKTLPIGKEEIYISGELYFAKRSTRSWNGGGVGFLRTDVDANHQVLGRMYLITKEQFLEVIQQENDSPEVPEIDFGRAITEGEVIFREGWYGKLLYLGEQHGNPIFTFTNAGIAEPINRPSEAYLKTIISGIRETYENMGTDEIIDYLISKDGVVNNYTRRKIQSLLEG